MLKKLQDSVKKVQQNFSKKYSNVQTKEIIGELKYPIQHKTSEGLLKTKLTDRLIILSTLSYEMEE